jgi:DNA-binding HxlR family transcriptional regulator
LQNATGWRNNFFGGTKVKRKSFGDMDCPIAKALDVIGEWWSLLIIREAFWGTRRFGDFEARLGIARNILTSRLSTLVEHGILQRVPSVDGSKYLEYELTEKGQALAPVLIALSVWGSKWVLGRERSPKQIREYAREERLKRAEDYRAARLADRRRSA